MENGRPAVGHGPAVRIGPRQVVGGPCGIALFVRSDRTLDDSRLRLQGFVDERVDDDRAVGDPLAVGADDEEAGLSGQETVQRGAVSLFEGAEEAA